MATKAKSLAAACRTRQREPFMLCGSRPECGCMTAREEARSGLVCPDPPRWPEKEPSSRLNSRTARLSPHRDTPNPCLNRSGGSHFLFRRKWHQFRDFMPNGIFDRFCVRLLRGLPNPVAMLLGQVVEEMHVVERVVSRVGHWLLPKNQAAPVRDGTAGPIQHPGFEGSRPHRRGSPSVGCDAASNRGIRRHFARKATVVKRDRMRTSR